MSNPENNESPVAKAASLAAWLIRTHRQPPAKANYIAARKFGADLHAVAQAVGARGPRRASKLRGDNGSDVGKSVADASAAPPATVIRCLVAWRGPAATRGAPKIAVRLQAIDGSAASQMEIVVPIGEDRGVRPCDVVDVEIAHDPDPDGHLRLKPMRIVAVSSGLGGEVAAADGEVLRLRVDDLDPPPHGAGNETRLRGEVLDGPCAGDTMDLSHPDEWLPGSAHLRDVIELSVKYENGRDGRPWPALIRCLRVVPAAIVEVQP